MNAPTLRTGFSIDNRPNGVVIGGQLSDPVFASAAKAFFESMGTGPVKFGPPAPKFKIDWTQSKEANVERLFADLDKWCAR